jgi:hypothetical protein
LPDAWIHPAYLRACRVDQGQHGIHAALLLRAI